MAVILSFLISVSFTVPNSLGDLLIITNLDNLIFHFGSNYAVCQLSVVNKSLNIAYLLTYL